MQTQGEDKKKTIVLLAIIVVVLVFAFKMATKQYANPNDTYVPPPVTTLSIEQPILTKDSSSVPPVDPFWRPISLPVVHTAAAIVGPQPPAAGVTTGPVPAAAGGATAAAMAPNLQDLELQGIVSDSTSVAIVRVGEAVRYLSAGSVIDAYTRLVRVLPGSIEIAQGKLKIRLVLGQTLIRHESQPGPAAPSEQSPVLATKKPPTSQYSSHE